jgi:hypothetical protein
MIHTRRNGGIERYRRFFHYLAIFTDAAIACYAATAI